MNEDILDSIANEIVEKIEKMPVGTEFIIGNLFREYELDIDSKFKVQEVVLNLCKEKQINIINTQPDAVLGMPWVFKYKKI